MINIQDKVNCSGCGACYNVCPKLAITMKFDEEGFRYPDVNLNLCINCNLCERVCPIIHPVKEEVAVQRGYLLQIKDDNIRRESTSGGAFTAIASWVIANGGVVYGARMSDSLDGVFHCKAETLDELGLFRNSKYVQSDTGTTFKQVKQSLNAGKWVCYSGTPCQIEGLVSYLGHKEYERLVLIDVVCYGIPSPGLFCDYIAYQQKQIGGKFTKILFREKRLSYNYTSFSIFNADDSKDYHRGVERDKFMRSFFSNRNMRPACYDCRFKKRYRLSDFTIWDCYDVTRFSKNFDENGTNRVLTHTQKARSIVNSIRENVRIEEYSNLDYFIKDEIAMTQSAPMPPDRAEFFSDYTKMPVSQLLEKWYPDTIKVRLNSTIRLICFKLGIYNIAKRTVKKILNKN